jgi:Ca2+-binding EF-hand superfamily protein
MSVQRTIVVVAISATVLAPAAFAQGSARARAQADDQTRRPSAEEMRFRGMDVDNDGVITRAEWRGNDQAFREQDNNGDGVLSGDEVRPRGGAMRTRRSERARREALIARFSAMDTDNDGVITRSEWRGNAQTFREQDANADGVLSGDEVRPAAGQDAVQPDRNRREQMAARFERADQDRDGRLLREEWPGNDATFNRMDTNRDLVVSYDEFTAVVDDRILGSAGERTATRAYQAGFDRGLAEGREAGRQDKSVSGRPFDLEGQRELEQADSGYREELGARADYQSGYRAGFRVGYREGFGPRR